jgi:hypothetical protein
MSILSYIRPEHRPNEAALRTVFVRPKPTLQASIYASKIKALRLSLLSPFLFQEFTHVRFH